MTNGEKYVTAEERAKAHKAWCGHNAKGFRCAEVGCVGCALRWLDLEAEKDRILPCPFCGGVTHVYDFRKVGHTVKFICDKCYMELALGFDMCDSVERYNRVARAVMDAKESEAK